MKVDSLVRMANQISKNVPDRQHAVDQTAAHLKAFWSPEMVDALDTHVQSQPDDVDETVRAALAVLRPTHS